MSSLSSETCNSHGACGPWPAQPRCRQIVKSDLPPLLVFIDCILPTSRNIEEEMLRNLFSYGKDELVMTEVWRKIAGMLSKTAQQENREKFEAALTLLWHLSKGARLASSFSYKVGNLDTQFLDIPLYRKETERHLMEVTKFLSHPYLRQKQMSLVAKILHSTAHELPAVPRVVPVSLADAAVRGWCGINSLYVNLTAFQRIPLEDYKRAHMCTNLAHELSMHFYLRKIEGDWNFSTPIKLDVCAEDKESGRLIELELFNGHQPDWFHASLLPGFNSELVKSWVACALSHDPLPLLDFSVCNRKSSTREFDEQEIEQEDF